MLRKLQEVKKVCFITSSPVNRRKAQRQIKKEILQTASLDSSVRDYNCGDVALFLETSCLDHYISKYRWALKKMFRTSMSVF